MAVTPALSRLSAAPLLLVVLLLSVFVVPISIAGTAVTLPTIAAELGADTVPLQWVVNGFNAAFAVFTLVWGVLGDRIGYRVTFVVGTVAMIGAAAFSALASNLILLDVARIIGGAAAAAIFTSAASIMSNVYTGPARGKAFGLLGTVLGLGIAFGPVLSGLLTAAFGWRGVFVVLGAAAVVALALSGAVPTVRHERLAGRKLLDFSILADRHFLALSLVPIVQAVGFVTLLTYLPVALSAVWGLGAGASGLVMLVMTVPMLFLPALAVRAIARSRRVSVMGVIYVALGSMIVGNLLLLFVHPGLPLPWLFAPLVLLGAGMGLPLGFIDGEALAAVPPERSGIAAGVFNFLRLGAETVAVGGYAAVLAALIALHEPDAALAARIASGETGHASAYAEAFRAVQLGVLVVLIVGSVAIALLHRAKSLAVSRDVASPQLVVPAHSEPVPCGITEAGIAATE